MLRCLQLQLNISSDHQLIVIEKPTIIIELVLKLLLFFRIHQLSAENTVCLELCKVKNFKVFEVNGLFAFIVRRFEQGINLIFYSINWDILIFACFKKIRDK